MEFLRNDVEIMIRGNSAGASDNMRLSTVIEYLREKVSVRCIVCENCSGPPRLLGRLVARVIVAHAITNSSHVVR